MKVGSLKWDDEDEPSSSNEKHGVLPDGEYKSDTLVYYCCQDHGHWNTSIELPIKQPFYLLPHNSAKCQRVKWAMSTLEYITYDTEDTENYDQFRGYHVFTNQVKSLPKIYYCYYKGIVPLISRMYA